MIKFGNSNLRFGRKTARLSNRMNTVLLTISECIQNKRLFPALILIYSSIDILGSFQNQDGYATRESFKDWTTNYLLREKTFQFDECDLWGARCGVIHTMRYDSQYGAALKEIIYGFHGYEADIHKITDPTKQIGVYVEDLFEALQKSYLRYLEDLENSSNPIVSTNLDKLPKFIDLIPITLQ